MIASFIEQLTSNSIISAAYLFLDATKLSSLRRHHFGHLQLRHNNEIFTTPNWQGENLHLPVIIDGETVGELIFSVLQDQIDQSFISKQMELVSDLVHGVIGRHLSLEREVELRKRLRNQKKRRRSLSP